MDRTHSANVLGIEDGSLSQPPPRASRRPPFPGPASREVPGGVDTGGWVTTGGQQRPFADPTRSSSQLSQRRAPLGAGRRGGGRVLGVPASPHYPLLSSPGVSLEPGGQPLAGGTAGGAGPGLWAGGTGALPSRPARPSPQRPQRSAGRSPRVSPCLRHRPCG